MDRTEGFRANRRGSVMNATVFPNPPLRCAVSSETHIEFRGVSKTYKTRKSNVVALSDINLTIRRNEFVSLVGPSGCGKSTILKILAGLTSVSAGIIDRRSFGTASWDQTSIGFVFQSPVLLPWKSVMSNVLFPAVTQGRNKAEALDHAQRLLALVGLSGFENCAPSELSGGMQQRVAICRALMCAGDVLLMDEPFGALDAITRDSLMVELKRICEAEKRTVLFVTHSISEAVFLADRVVVMSPRPGRISSIVNVAFAERDVAVLETLPFQRLVAAIRTQVQEDMKGETARPHKAN
jgi:NitT/TauT family transport system ATP-binding protein